MKAGRELRKILEEEAVIVVPGVHDALSALVAQAVGFRCIYLGSFATSASMLGRCDAGLITQSEMLTAMRNVCFAVSIPVIGDGENGYGSALNVARTVAEFERTGVAGVHIEDCAVPKHIRGIPDRVTSKEEMIQKVRAAVDSRDDKDFVIIARTDAKSVYGLSDAVSRCKAYAEAGADMAFIVGLTLEEAAEVSQQIPVPLFATSIYAPLQELAEKGVKLAVYSAASLGPSYNAVLAAMRELYTNGPTQTTVRSMGSPAISDVVGMDKVADMVRKYQIAE